VAGVDAEADERLGVRNAFYLTNLVRHEVGELLVFGDAEHGDEVDAARDGVHLADAVERREGVGHLVDLAALGVKKNDCSNHSRVGVCAYGWTSTCTTNIRPNARTPKRALSGVTVFPIVPSVNDDSTAPGGHHVYIVECSDGTYYTGYTTDVDRRVAEHNDGTAAKYTRGRRPVTLVHVETYDTQSEAMQREYAIKQLRRAAKERLVRNGDQTES